MRAIRQIFKFTVLALVAGFISNALAETQPQVQLVVLSKSGDVQASYAVTSVAKPKRLWFREVTLALALGPNENGADSVVIRFNSLLSKSNLPNAFAIRKALTSASSPVTIFLTEGAFDIQKMPAGFENYYTNLEQLKIWNNEGSFPGDDFADAHSSTANQN